MDEIILTDENFLVSQTDKKGNIIFANDDFCKISGYSNKELVGKPHNIIRHPDMPKSAFKNLWETVQRGEIWQGFVKNKSRSGGFYWVFATIYPLGEGYMSCRVKATPQEIENITKVYENER